MKKVILVVCLVFAILFVTGCETGSNRDISSEIFDNKFSHAYCYYGDKEYVFEIEKWKDYEGEQWQIKTNENVIILSANNCIFTKYEMER